MPTYKAHPKCAVRTRTNVISGRGHKNFVRALRAFIVLLVKHPSHPSPGYAPVNIIALSGSHLAQCDGELEHE